MGTALAKHPTKNGSLTDVARHVVLPSGIVSTGWPAVREKCAEFGVEFDDWQHGAGRAILAKRKNGKYACSIGGAVLSIPRQVGKTFLVGSIIFALCLLTPGTKVLWTAHRLRTGNETFAKMQAFAGRKSIAPRVKQIYIGSGEGEIVFRNGSRILFGARERGFGRGFDDVDIEVFDEAQILTENAIDDMVPATATAENALLFFIGTPPKPTDPSEVFTQKRAEALSGTDDDTLYIEFSADEDARPDDRKQWAQANPSHPERTPVSSIQRMLKNLSPESFLRECLGIWAATVKADPFSINAEAFAGLAVAEHRIEYDRSTARMALVVAWDRSWSTIAVVGTNSQGFAQAKLVESRVGTQWAAEAVAGFWSELGNGLPVLMVAGESLADEVRALKVDVVEMKPGEIASATQKLLDAVGADAPSLRHDGRSNLLMAAEMVSIRPYGNAGLTMSDRHSDGDISPLKALTLAFGRLGVDSEPPPRIPLFAVTR